MTSTFAIETRRKASFGTFFPEALRKERHIWNRTQVATTGLWTKYRLITGNHAGLYQRIIKVAEEYSALRKSFPDLDIIRLFEESAQVRATGLEYYDYAGRIDTISRESVVVRFPSGATQSLARDTGVGFRGIVVKTEEPWSMQRYALNELMRLRILALNTGRAMPQIEVSEPWLLRQATETQLYDMMVIARAEYAAEPTMDRLKEISEIEKAYLSYIEETLEWMHRMGSWEHMEKIPFPDASGAIALWEQDRIKSLDYDQTSPWFDELAEEPESEVTAILKAIMSTGRVNITITTNPVLTSLEHPLTHVAHHLIRYSVHDHIGVGLPNPLGADRYIRPFVGVGDDGIASPRIPAWSGTTLPQRPGWTAITSEEHLPEPKLRLKARAVSVPRGVAERLSDAVGQERPMLVYENINHATCPLLVLPRIYFKVQVVPLFEAGVTVKPVEDGNTIEGWATKNTGMGNADLVGPVPHGFLSSSAEGRPLREGTIQDVLPYV